MNNIFKSLLAAAVVAPALTGCVEETFPTSGATQDQLAASSKATEALLWAMPAYYNTFDIMDNGQPYDWGYGALMHVRDVMTCLLYTSPSPRDKRQSRMPASA